MPPSISTAADQIEHSARRADDNFGPATKVLDLPADRLAAVDGHHVHVPAGSQLDSFITHLNGQFAGRDKHQRLRSGRLEARLESFEDRNDEGRRLPGAGLGLAHDVDPGQCARDQAGLNGRGIEILGLVQGGQHRGRKSEPLESAHFFRGRLFFRGRSRMGMSFWLVGRQFSG